MMNSLATALPSGGRTLEIRAGAGRLVFAHLIVSMPSPEAGALLTMSRLALFRIAKARLTGMPTCNEPSHATL